MRKVALQGNEGTQGKAACLYKQYEVCAMEKAEGILKSAFTHEHTPSHSEV